MAEQAMIVKCFANRGRRYWVTFDENGCAMRVTGETRVIWRRGQVRQSITAECAIRAARATLTKGDTDNSDRSHL